ncbi:mobilome CxxCx(11)CxxC protein [Nocardia sp. NPDC004085]
MTDSRRSSTNDQSATTSPEQAVSDTGTRRRRTRLGPARRRTTTLPNGETRDQPTAADRPTVPDEVWQRKLHAFGTSYIFEQRANRYRKLLSILTFAGLIVPVVTGSFVAAYGARGLTVLLWVGGAVTLFQVVIFLWSLAADWVGSYQHATRSMERNIVLADSYESIEASSDSDYQRELSKLVERDRIYAADDQRQGITEPEKRMGMRAALRHYREECVGCNMVPTELAASECGVCGNFKITFRGVM